MLHALKPALVTPPAAPPVTLSEAKAHLRVEHSEDDTMITAMIAAAVSYLDGWTGILGRCLMPQAWRFDFARFPCDRTIRLGFPGMVSAGDDAPVVTYLDSAGAEQTLVATAYHTVEDALGSVLRLASGAAWPSTACHPAAVSVTATFGYPDAAAVPPAIKAAILLVTGDLYRNRETTGVGSGTIGAIPMSTTVDNLLAPYRHGFVSA